MPETTASLFAASLLFAIALLALLGGRAVSRRLGAVGQQLRAADERLVNETPLLAARMGVQRADMAELSTAAERALWSLSRFDERIDTIRTGLAARRATLDHDRTRLVAARATMVRVRRTAQMLIKVIELRRAFLG